MAAKFLTKPKALLLVWCWRITISTLLRSQERGSQSRSSTLAAHLLPPWGSERPTAPLPGRCPYPLNPGVKSTQRSGVRRAHAGAVGSACPPAPRRSAPGAAQTPGRPDQGQELGLPAPPTQPPSPRQCKPAGKPAGELPAEAQERRLQRRAGLCGGRPAALRPPAAARSSRPLPLPRRLQHRAAEARGRRKPEEGGPGQGQRRHDSSSADQAGELGKARRRAESEAPGRALPSALGSGSQATAPSASGAAGSLLLLVCWRQTRGDHGRPRVHGGRCTAERGCGGSAPPGAGRQESSRAPTFRAGRTPAARPCRASGTENHHDGRARVKQRVASGQGVRHLCVKR
ncbi:uncharacterized protein LOC132683799 [Panthera onca]